MSPLEVVTSKFTDYIVLCIVNIYLHHTLSSQRVRLELFPYSHCASLNAQKNEFSISLTIWPVGQNKVSVLQFSAYISTPIKGINNIRILDGQNAIIQVGFCY